MQTRKKFIFHRNNHTAARKLKQITYLCFVEGINHIKKCRSIWFEGKLLNGKSHLPSNMFCQDWLFWFASKTILMCACWQMHACTHVRIYGNGGLLYIDCGWQYFWVEIKVRTLMLKKHTINYYLESRLVELSWN